jgi:hypothetical protein
MSADRRRVDGGRQTAANQAAVAYVEGRAEKARAEHVARIQRVLTTAGLGLDAQAVLAAAGDGAVITINFHPDRLLADHRSVSEALRDEGVYRSQFETHISNGGLGAGPGGDRDSWERGLFSGAYHGSGVSASERPKYGGRNLMNHLNGACPRFGSCHLRLRPELTGFATFSFGDSNAQPPEVGTMREFAAVLAPLLERVAAEGSALGRPGVGLGDFVDGLMRGDHVKQEGAFAAVMSNGLNDYIEAQIHAPLTLAADVDAVVVDPAFRGAPELEPLLEAAGQHGVAIEWHYGHSLPLDAVPLQPPEMLADGLMRWQQFCAGGRARRLAERVVSEHGSDRRQLDALNIGRAAADAVRNPDRWSNWAEPHELLVNLKDLWLMVVASGQISQESPGATP